MAGVSVTKTVQLASVLLGLVTQVTFGFGSVKKTFVRMEGRSNLRRLRLGLRGENLVR